MAWTIRNYNAFVRAARADGLSLKEARGAYRVFVEKIGRSATGADAERHSRQLQEAAREARNREERERRSEAARKGWEQRKERERAERERRSKAAEKGWEQRKNKYLGGGPKITRVASAQQWERLYDAAVDAGEELDVIEIAAGVDTGKKR